MRRTSLRPRPEPPPAPDQPERATAADRAARRALAADRAREVEEPPAAVRDKVRRLAAAVLQARHLVVYTGAGVSTAAAIPDYRGPAGVWTRLASGRPAPLVDLSAARPTYTHMALAALWRARTLRFLVSQNCDGLHLRSGLPRRALAELHGDMLLEVCAVCERPHLRRFDTTERTARHRHRTRRLCRACGQELRDTIVHFGERGRARWPLNWRGAVRHARRADVLLVLGSSLKVLRRYPGLWPRARPPRLFIVNLQWTPKDAAAELKISARCDDVMRLLARELGLAVPRYCPRADPLWAHHTPLLAGERHTARRAPLPSPPASPASSDDDTPLTELARRLRAPLRSATVQLASGPATVLLRARHAPDPAPSALRRFRRPKAHGYANGYANGYAAGPPSPAEEEAMRRCVSLARACMARALLVCRARLYPGLHTCLAEPGPQCGWCWRRGASRCQYYPRAAGPGLPRREAGRLRWCSCCRAGAAPASLPDRAGAGWFGKGRAVARRRKR